jgi:hypothetical protein
MSDSTRKAAQTGAQLVVRALEAQGVTHVFRVPGPKSRPYLIRWWIRRSRRWCAATSRTRRSSPAGSAA